MTIIRKCGRLVAARQRKLPKLRHGYVFGIRTSVPTEYECVIASLSKYRSHDRVRSRWGNTDHPVAIEVLVEVVSIDSSAGLVRDVALMRFVVKLPLLSVAHTIY